MLVGFASVSGSVESHGMWRFKRMANDAAIFSKLSVLVKVEKDTIKDKQIFVVILA